LIAISFASDGLRAAAAERFEVSASSAIKWMQRWHETGSVAAKPSVDMPSVVKKGTQPLVPFLAQLQIQRLRPQRRSSRLRSRCQILA
jgi:transposase